jgi:RNA polymerase sigma-70 factor (ECF subfamily)
VTPLERETLFRQWIEEYARIIFKVVRAYAVERPDQDDLFQEIALQLWASIPSFQGHAKPSTWIYKVALNTALVWRRKEGKHQRGREAFEVLEGVPVLGPNPARASEQRETLSWLYSELHALDKADRSLALLYLDDMSYRDMAEILGISESNVGGRINRLKRHLADAYARRVS